MADAALRLSTLAEELLGAPLPVRIRTWDGSESGPPGAPTLVFRHRRALRRLLWKPGELGLARGWVAGEIDIDGDLYAALGLIAGLVWERDADADAKAAVHPLRDPRLRAAAKGLVGIVGPWPPPPPPPEEVRRRSGALHTKHRDRAAISHHYDVGNDFYEMVLGTSMVYSCAYFEEPGATLEDAQRDKLDLVCRKLGLREGERLLDVGCGWGSMAIHAAREYGVQVTGVTLSREQAAYARKRIADEGLTDRIEIRVQDYRDVKDGPYDAISSIGMAEHVGSVRYREYADDLFALLKPGRPAAQPPDRAPPREGRIPVPHRRLHRRVRLPRRRTGPARPHRRHPGGGGLRGPRRRIPARALRADAPSLGAESGAALARGGPGHLARPRPRVAPLHGRVGAVLRAQQDRRQPDPGGPAPRIGRLGPPAAGAHLALKVLTALTAPTRVKRVMGRRASAGRSAQAARPALARRHGTLTRS